MAESRKREPVWNWFTLIALVWNMFMMDGAVRCYGLLYLELLDMFGEGPQKTGLVATIFAVFALVTAPISGWLTDKFSPKLTVVLAAVLGPSGMILSAFAPSLLVVYIGYGCILGSSQSAIFTATATGVSKLFTHNRPLASGILFAGGSLGSMLLPLLFRFLSDTYSTRGVLIIFAGLMLNYAVSGAMIRTDKAHFSVNTEIVTKEVQDTNLNEASKGDDGTKSLEHKSSAGKKSCRALASSIFNIKFMAYMLFELGFIYGLYGFIMYIPPYAKENGMSDIQQTLLLTVLGGTDLFGRLVVGFLGNLSWVNIYILVTVNLIVVGVFVIFLPVLLSLSPVFVLLMVAVAVVGFFVGGLTALLNQLVVDAVGLEYAGTAMGISNISFSLGVGLPPVIYGALKESIGSYIYVPRLSGAALIFAGIAIQIGQLTGRCRKWCRRSRSSQYTVN